VALRELAVTLTDTYVAEIRELPPGRKRDETLSSQVHNLAIAFSALGRNEAALAAAEEAVALLEKLARDGDVRSKARLARGLTSLANRLSDCGRDDEAKAAARRSVALARIVVAEAPTDDNRGLLAFALMNVAAAAEPAPESDPHAASELIDEATELLDGLSESDPGAERALARALHNKTVVLKRIGRMRDAVEAIESAVAILRRLLDAEDYDPTAHELAIALDSLADTYLETRRIADARRAVEESISLYRQLALRRPKVFEQELASTLSTLASVLARGAVYEEARRAAEESVAIFERAVLAGDERSERGLASALNTLGRVLAENSDALADSRSPLERAARMYRELPKTTQTRANYLGTLNNLAYVLIHLDEASTALEHLEEIVAQRRLDAQDRTEGKLDLLAGALSNLAYVLDELGHSERALTAVTEAVALRKQLAGAGAPGADQAAAAGLRNLAVLLRALERPREALAHIEESVEMLQPLVSDGRSDVIPSLLESLEALSKIREALGEDRADVDAEAERVRAELARETEHSDG
jgi:tetratricopeptide (TPR) repeat protein